MKTQPCTRAYPDMKQILLGVFGVKLTKPGQALLAVSVSFHCMYIYKIESLNQQAYGLYLSELLQQKLIFFVYFYCR